VLSLPLPAEPPYAAIVGQHRDLAGTRALLGRLALRHGAPVPGLGAGLDRAFPAADVVKSADLAAAGLPAGLADTVGRFAAAVAGGAVRLDGTAGLDDLVASLTAIPGIGDAAAHHLAMRLGERDAFPAGDPAVVAALGLDAAAVAQAWRPWRALAAAHVLTAAGH
jgi:AraC family transcriptional regulator of adaptative response / DNA-3-methyladenine glycosylase II